jgi:hypothetical protein
MVVSFVSRRRATKLTTSGLSAFTQGCSKSTRAAGLSLGSFTKQCFKKSTNSGEIPSGSGGKSSSTIRKRTDGNQLGLSRVRSHAHQSYCW